jgi:RAT1-interacting protein
MTSFSIPFCTPYENEKGWKIAAARHRNCIYMCEYETQQKVNDKRCKDPRQKEMSYWGFKFEQYVTSGELKVVIISYECATPLQKLRKVGHFL